MTPTLVHRYALPIREAIETLLGDAVGDCDGWRIRVEGDEVVIDVLAPAPGITPTLEDIASLSPTGGAEEALDAVGPEIPDAPAAPTLPAAEPEEPEMKGGPLARRAAIACSERGFWTFLGVSSAEDAKANVCRRCGITTRKMLDHDERAAAVWQDIDGKYRLWLEGHDVEI
ncbi:MAG: hypothetical protein M9939_26500 [Mesorhizobium sp.]|nr:hypothetical protein [Mesorhizobium sp.]MCO5085102.1 hypothetical protein [Rhizobiaceae bacterium]MCO5164644.1 hypothetical protein [Mesorhizobium sp.]